jgi:hypothetical protein
MTQLEHIRGISNPRQFAAFSEALALIAQLGDVYNIAAMPVMFNTLLVEIQLEKFKIKFFIADSGDAYKYEAGESYSILPVLREEVSMLLEQRNQQQLP